MQNFLLKRKHYAFYILHFPFFAIITQFNIPDLYFFYSLRSLRVQQFILLSNSKFRRAENFNSVKQRSSKHSKSFWKYYSKLKRASIFYYQLQHYIKLLLNFFKHNYIKISWLMHMKFGIISIFSLNIICSILFFKLFLMHIVFKFAHEKSVRTLLPKTNELEISLMIVISFCKFLVLLNRSSASCLAGHPFCFSSSFLSICHYFWALCFGISRYNNLEYLFIGDEDLVFLRYLILKHNANILGSWYF